MDSEYRFSLSPRLNSFHAKYSMSNKNGKNMNVPIVNYFGYLKCQNEQFRLILNNKSQIWSCNQKQIFDYVRDPMLW